MWIHCSKSSPVDRRVNSVPELWQTCIWFVSLCNNYQKSLLFAFIGNSAKGLIENNLDLIGFQGIKWHKGRALKRDYTLLMEHKRSFFHQKITKTFTSIEFVDDNTPNQYQVFVSVILLFCLMYFKLKVKVFDVASLYLRNWMKLKIMQNREYCQPGNCEVGR